MIRKTAVALVLFLCFGAFPAFGQVSFSESNDAGYVINGASPSPFVSVTVADSVSSKPLPGATVFVSGGHDADTLKMVSNENGHIPLVSNRFMKDTISVYVSYLGYKPVSFRHPVSKRYVKVRVKLQEDPQQINSIIITDKAVAMVIRGDTTIYNAAAFKTMKGERLRGLLKQLPGVEVKGDKVYAQGREISRIMVNGTTLFNRDVKSAMDMIMSDEVLKIRLYDQHDPDRLIEQDTLGRKEKVLDVATKNPKLLAQEGYLSLAAGAFTDRNIDGEVELLGGVQGTFRRFELEKPQYTAAAEIDHNVNKNLQGSTSKPVEAALANLIVAQAIPRKLNYQNMFSFNYDAMEDESRTEDRYNPTASYDSRYVESERFSRNDKIQALYHGRVSTKIKNSQLKATLAAGYFRDVTKASDYLNSSIDGDAMVTDVSSYDKTGSGYFQLDVSYDQFFRKRGRRLSVGASYIGNFGGGGGWRLDTLSTSSAPQWIINDAASRSNKPQIDIKYIEPLGKNLYLNLSYTGSADFSDSRRIATDHLTGYRDTLNTFDYTNRNIRNNATVSMRYKREKIEIMAGADFNSSVQLRSEVFPESFEYPAAFNHIAPYLSMEFNIPFFKLTVGYNESTVIPSIEQLRGVIDNSSPLFLTAGNPELEHTVCRNAKLDILYSDVAAAATWGLTVDYEERSNYIANKTMFFASDTELENYGYVAPAGSQLSLPVNVDGCRSLASSLSCHFRLANLNSTFFTALNYNFGQTPYFTGDVLHGNDNHNLGLNFRYNSGFSKYVQLALTYTGNIGRALNDGSKLYDAMGHNVSASLYTNFLKRWWFGAYAGYNFNMTTMGYRYESVPTSVKLSCKFGKNDAAEIGLSLYDIINLNRSSSVSVFDEYVRYQYDRIFGRSIFLSFAYSFK